MKTKTYLSISCIVFLLGTLFYAYYHEYIILNFKKQLSSPHKQESSAKQKVTLYWWKNGWKSDVMQLLLNQNICHDAQLIIGNWLETALDEQILGKKITAQSAMVSADHQQLYISFDRTPFGKESSTFEKWMIIEGILKTLKITIPAIKKIHFLINHQPLTDAQIDFSNPWPIEGFI